MSNGESSGVDLARVALRAAMEQARKNGGGQKAKQKLRPVRTVRRDRHEPMGLGAAIGALVTERAWELPAAGGTVLDLLCTMPTGDLLGVQHRGDGHPGRRSGRDQGAEDCDRHTRQEHRG
ncbi:hypothetical protein ACWCP8_40875 [Streptomyces sp. NPDC002206]